MCHETINCFKNIGPIYARDKVSVRGVIPPYVNPKTDFEGSMMRLDINRETDNNGCFCQ